MRASGLCAFPYNGRLAVVDNYFMIPGISSGWANNDPFDQALGHELGHTLGLGHRNWDIHALMNTNQQHNGPGGTVSNIAIYPDEVTKLRESALMVPGAELDPDNKIIQGDVVQSIKVDRIQENESLQPFEDISSIVVSVDKRQNLVAFGQELFGPVPEKIQTNRQYWTFVDLDNDKNTGVNETLLQEIGILFDQFSLGADLVICAEGNTNSATGNIWTVKKDDITLISPNMVQFDIQTVSVHLNTAGMQPPAEMDDIPLYSSINAIFNNTGNFIELDRPFSIQAIVYSNGTVADRLNDEIDQDRKTLELKQPLFSQCFVNEIAHVGNNATIQVSGLLPNESLHALLGPRVVANGTTTASGNSTIQFVVPNDATPGLHLITVGVDDTALTADCQIEIENVQKLNTTN